VSMRQIEALVAVSFGLSCCTGSTWKPRCAPLGFVHAYTEIFGATRVTVSLLRRVRSSRVVVHMKLPAPRSSLRGNPNMSRRVAASCE